MIDQIDSLNLEIIQIQLQDQYFRDGYTILDKNFFRKGIQPYVKGLTEVPSIADDLLDFEESEEEQEEFFTLDDVMCLLADDLDAYEKLYDIGEVTIKNSEWDLLFETICDYYEEIGNLDYYIEDMVQLNKFAVAKSLVYGQKEINLETYISSLKYMYLGECSNYHIMEIAKRLEDAFGINAIEMVDGIVEDSKKEYFYNILLDEKTNQEKSTDELTDTLEKLDCKVAPFDYDIKDSFKQKAKIINFNDYKANRNASNNNKF